MYKSFSIQNFRGIKKFELDGLEKINLFLGPNNCGKTSILEALFLLTGISKPNLYANINAFRGLVFTESNDLRFNYYNLDYNSNLRLSGTFSNKSHERTLSIKPIFSSNVSNGSGSIALTLSQGVSASESTNSDRVNGVKYEFEIKENSIEKKYNAELRNVGGLQFDVKLSENYLESILGIFVHPNTVGTNLAERVDRVIVNKEKEKLIPYLAEIDKNISDISLGKNQMVYFDIGASQLIPVNLSGDGIKKILSVLVSIHNAADGIVFIDEIDNGLHFSALSVIWRAILKMASEKNVQLFITTHDKECLKNLASVLKEGNFSNYQSKTRCYTIKKLLGDEVKAYEHDFESLDFSLNQDIEIRGIV